MTTGDANPPKDFETVLAELEAVTVLLLGTDPHELERARGLLERRQDAVGAVAEHLGRGDLASQVALVERTRMAWEQGRVFEERLRLVRADSRLHLQELYRVNFHLHALAHAGGAGESSAWSSSASPGLDLQA